MLHDAIHVGFHHHTTFGGFKHHAHHRGVRHDFHNAVTHARIFEAFHHFLGKTRPVERVDAFNAVLDLVFGVHGRIYGQITAFGVTGQQYRPIPQRGDFFQVFSCGNLCWNRVLEGHVEVFLPSDQRIIGASKRHNQRSRRQPESHRRELRLRTTIELLAVRAHLNVGKPRIRRHSMVEVVRHLRIDQSYVRHIMVGYGLVVVQLVIGTRNRHAAKRGLAQHMQRCDRTPNIELLRTRLQRTVFRHQIVQ